MPQESTASQPATTPYRWVDSQSELDRCCERWMQLDSIGIDTEFVRTRTFFARLGLVQIRAEEENWLIDPVAIGELAPLHLLLSSERPTKVIHSGSEDIEIFNRLGEAPLRGFFDTQVAAALCGLGPSLSYQALVMELLDIEVEKDQTRSDWMRRPLSESQKRYAALDVEWLPRIHAKLHARLDQLGRLDWLAEDCALAVSRSSLEDQVGDLFRKFKLAWQMDGADRAALWALLLWRERTARDRDRPRRHILADNDLLALVQARPADESALDNLQLEQPRAVKRFAAALLPLMAEARVDGPVPEAPPEPLDREMRGTVKLLRRQIGETAEALGIAPEFLCGKREVLHVLQHNEPSARLEGWRLTQLEQTFDPWLDNPS